MKFGQIRGFLGNKNGAVSFTNEMQVTACRKKGAGGHGRQRPPLRAGVQRFALSERSNLWTGKNYWNFSGNRPTRPWASVSASIIMWS